MAISTGEVSGSATAKQLPSIVFDDAMQVQAVGSNAGNVYIGGSGVTRPDGTTDTTTGRELAPGDYVWLIGPGNLDEYYIICDNATDDIVYMSHA